MANVFGFPIVLAIVLGITFPYTAVLLMPYGIVFLFLLMIWAGLTIDWRKLRNFSRYLKELSVGLLFLYILFPFVQSLLAHWLLTDSQYLYGVVFASLCPVAIVAPFFTQLTRSDEEFSFLLMVVSMVLFPIAAPIGLQLFLSSSVPVNLAPLVKYMLLLVTVPLLISYLIGRFLPGIRTAIHPYLAVLNMASLSILIFILFGTAVGRLNIHYTATYEIWVLLLLVFIQDFGVLFLSRIIFHLWFDRDIANALAISLSMKNVAIAAGILLFYDPRASFPAALVFVAHACLFSFIALTGSRKTALWQR
jgi:predicted Na+-dependent transporter